MQFNKYTHTHRECVPFVAFDQRFSLHVSLIPPWEDQCEWHRMTRMTRPDCAVMCNLINAHTHTHTRERGRERGRGGNGDGDGGGDP